MLAAALLAVSACGAPTPAEAAPRFTVHGAGEPLELRAWTFCTENMCADGRPPDHPADVGGVDQVQVDFSERNWTLTAEFAAQQRDGCIRTYQVPLTRVSGSRWTLAPAGPAGTYDVTLGAQGDQHGDAVATFRWTTPRKGTMPAPRAQLLTEYFDLHVSNLATTPRTGALEVTVTAADGRTTVVRPKYARPEDQGATCRAPGRIDFSDSQLDADRDLGPQPLRYDVRLTLDGADHRASAVLPDDAKDDGHVYVDLTFDPPLPPFTG